MWRISTRPRLLLALLLLTLAPCVRAAAQTNPEGERGLTEVLPSREQSMLVFANRPITVLRARVLASRPSDRAAAAVARLDELLANNQSGPVTSREEKGVAFIRVGDRDVITLVPADLDALTNETMESKRSEAANRLRGALAEAVELRTPRRMLWSGARAIGATIAFVLMMVGLLRIHRRVTRYLIEMTEQRLGRVMTTDSARPHGAWFASVERRATTIALFLISVILTYGWTTFVLRQFPYTRPWGESMRGFLIARFSRLGLDIIQSIPDLFMVVVIAISARVVVQLSNRVFRSIETGEFSVPWIHPDTAAATRRFTAALLWILALMIAYPYIPGSDSDAFKGISVFIGLVVSLGSSGIVNQLMSGLTIIYSRALKVGDVVKIGDVEGVVTAMNMLSVKLRTFQGEEVTVPNAVVISNSTTNHTRPATQGATFLGTEVTIGYDTPWRQVKALLILAAERTGNVRREPRPRVLHRSLEDFYVRYRLLVCLDDPVDRAATLDRLLANILDAFNEFGVQITSPHYETDPTSQKTVAPDKWFDAPAVPDAHAELRADAVPPFRSERVR
jgi:small-conductance mechanosensitive channel